MAKKERNTVSQGVSLPKPMFDWITRRGALTGNRFSTELTELLRPLMSKDFVNQLVFEEAKNGSWAIKSTRSPDVLKDGFTDKEAALDWAEAAGFNRRGFLNKKEEVV